MDSTTQVTNDTTLVIPMEVPVDKAAHYAQQSSDGMVYAVCVGSLTDHTKHTTRGNQLPRPRPHALILPRSQ